jgi:hypothetical protein
MKAVSHVLAEGVARWHVREKEDRRRIEIGQKEDLDH